MQFNEVRRCPELSVIAVEKADAHDPDSNGIDGSRLNAVLEAPPCRSERSCVPRRAHTTAAGVWDFDDQLGPLLICVHERYMQVVIGFFFPRSNETFNAEYAGFNWSHTPIRWTLARRADCREGHDRRWDGPEIDAANVRVRKCLYGPAVRPA